MYRVTKYYKVTINTINTLVAISAIFTKSRIDNCHFQEKKNYSQTVRTLFHNKPLAINEYSLELTF